MFLLSLLYYVIPGSKILVSSPQCPDRLWDTPNLLFNGYMGVLSPGLKRQWREAYDFIQSSAKWPSVSKMELYLQSRIYSHGIMLY
jgi:hypothetical protein